MLLNKTDRARDALAAGASAGLALLDRRILILTDGKRSLNQVMAMLGAGILPAIDRLMRDGYITQHDAVPVRHVATTPALGGAVSGLLRAATEAVQARTEQIRAATPAPPATSSDMRRVAPAVAVSVPRAIPDPASASRAPATRRSLAASKMYLLDMLQLQRTAEAAELRAAIQCAAGPTQLIDASLQALRMLVGVSTPSYGDRILSRLAETMPEEALSRLEALRAERAGVASLTVVAA